MIGPIALIIPDGQKANANAVWGIFDPDFGGANTFSVPLSASSTAPATHWGANSYLEDATNNALRNMTSTQFKAYMDGLAADRQRTAPGAVGFKSSLIMGAVGQNFWEVATANGLKRVATPL